MAEIIGGDKLAQKIANLESVLNFNEPLQEACLLVENAAKRNLTENGAVGTGELRNSITHQVVGNVGYVGSNLKYAPYVEFGTGIYAKNGDGRKSPWVYYVPGGYTYHNPETGQDEQAFFVTTEGQHPRPYLHPALDGNKEMIAEIFKIFIDRELGK